MQEKECVFCGEKLTFDMCAYWNFPAHIGCAEQMIDVYKITSVSAGGHYYDNNLDHVADMISESEYSDGYTITKEQMSAGQFKLLPEFQGF